MPTVRLALRAIPEVRVRAGSWSPCVSTRKLADVEMAPSGVRRSCPRMARKISFA